MSWWYVSIAGDDRCYGGCFVEAEGPVQAKFKAEQLFIKSGQLSLMIVPSTDRQMAENVKETDRNRFLSLAEMEKLWN